MTTTSNLKNNYGIIRVKENGEEAPSGCMYLGAFIGDYVTAGIGTLIPTGATWGPCINIYGGHLGPKYMPPFIWGTQKDWTVYEIDKAKSNFEVMMSRRKMLFNEESIKRFDSIYLSSTKERESFLS
jgi:glucose-1-phosphate thymidylyltransferase